MKYISPISKFLIALFFLMILPGIAGKSQDTTYVESIKNDSAELDSSGEHTAPVNETTEENPNYFLKKWEGYSSPDRLKTRRISDSAKKAFKEDDAFWYANATFEKEKIKPLEYREPFFQKVWFQTLLWLIIIASFAAGIIWWLSESNAGVFRKRDRKFDEEQSSTETDDIFAINFQRDIDRAIQQGNFRLAVRLMYLRLLKDLSERQIIQYTQDRTNFDYLTQLSPTPFYKEFFKVTRNYEFSWYGQFEVDEKSFRIIQNDFNQFNRKLK